MTTAGASLLNDRYLLTPFAQGGQGRLYLADDTRIQGKRWIAKHIDLNGTSPQDHPEVVVLRLGLRGLPALSEVLSDGAQAWIIRDLVVGGTLEELRTNQGAPFAMDVLIEIARGIGAILADLHGRGFGLIDVKPSNFVRSIDGRIMLIDPGSVGRLDHQPRHASGTLGFTAPEVSPSSVLRPTADVYGLAATLYWLQTMRTPGPVEDLSRDSSVTPLGRLATDALASALATRSSVRPTIADLLARLATTSGPSCSNCGTEIGAQKSFCGRCGVRVGDTIPMPPKPSASQLPRLLPPTRVTVSGALGAAIARRAAISAPTSPDLARHWRAAEALAVVDGFDRLIALDGANIDSYEHQRRAALTILQTFRGSGVLADEVGLGKTIEAGIVLNELVARQLASRVLILAPPHLQSKWALELSTKFNDSTFVVCGGPGNWGASRLIASHQQATRQWFAPAASGRSGTRLKKNLPEYDIVIVDEAHHLCRDDGSPTKLGELVAGLRRRYLLLLTATPIRRDIRELYPLITLVRPGEFRDRTEFEARVARPLMAKSSRQAAAGRIKEVLDKVMVRQRRRDIKVDWPDKQAFRNVVTLTPDERRIRDAAITRSRIETGQVARNLAVAAFSSPEAAAALLGWDMNEFGVSSKARRFLELVDRHSGDQIVAFADRPETLQSLERLLGTHGRPFIRYQGDKQRKLEAVRRFRGTAGSILLADHTIAEGSDLQFAHVLVAFDVPWNPYHLEQMVGRVYRIGQTKPVQIHAIVSDDGLDRELIDLYGESLAMFNRHVGEVDAILSELDDDMDFPKEVWAAVRESLTSGELHARFISIRSTIDKALDEMKAEEQWLRDMGLD